MAKRTQYTNPVARQNTIQVIGRLAMVDMRFAIQRYQALGETELAEELIKVRNLWAQRIARRANTLDMRIELLRARDKAS